MPWRNTVQVLLKRPKKGKSTLGHKHLNPYSNATQVNTLFRLNSKYNLESNGFEFFKLMSFDELSKLLLLSQSITVS